MRWYLMIVVSLHAVQLKSQDWILKRHEDGIKVFTAGDESSAFKKVKVEASFAGSIERLRSVLLDVANNKNWVYHTRESRLLETVSEDEVLYYAETSLPWPLSNRDIVIRMHLQRDSSGKHMLVTQVGEPNAIAIKQGIVRISQFEARWEIKEDTLNQVSITYYLSVNPSGNISAGISNMFVTKGPLETFSNLAHLIKNP